MITIHKNNYKEIFFLIQDEFNDLDLDIPDIVMFDFMNYIYDNEVECVNEDYYEMYEKVKLILEREIKINELLK